MPVPFLRNSTRRSSRPVGRPAAWSRPRPEALEDRTLPAVLTVTNLLDSGPGSLRAEINLAQSGDTITFAAGVRGTITLTSGELQLQRSVSIMGPGAGLLSVSGNDTWRVFEVFAGTTTISGLTITAGRANGSGTAAFGGGIYNAGTLTVTDSALSGNYAALRRRHRKRRHADVDRLHPQHQFRAGRRRRHLQQRHDGAAAECHRRRESRRLGRRHLHLPRLPGER